MRRPIRLFKRALAGSAVLLIASAAAASDDKTISGAVCRPFWDTFDNVPNITYPSGLLNQSDDAFEAFVTCPIERDTTIDTDGIAFLKVRVRDPSTSTQVCCTGYYEPVSGSEITTASTCSGNSFSGDTELTLPFLSNSMLGTYSVVCDAPNSYIQSLYWGE